MVQKFLFQITILLSLGYVLPEATKCHRTDANLAGDCEIGACLFNVDGVPKECQKPGAHCNNADYYICVEECKSDKDCEMIKGVLPKECLAKCKKGRCCNGIGIMQANAPKPCKMDNDCLKQKWIYPKQCPIKCGSNGLCCGGIRLLDAWAKWPPKDGKD